MTKRGILQQIQSDAYVPLRLQAYDVLRDAILTGQLEPGEHLGEEKVCRQLGISRSPLREALRRLEADGLIRIVPRQGAIVTEITKRDVADLFVVRKALEGLVARLATENITSKELAELDRICRAMEQCIGEHNVPAVVKANSQFHEVLIQASGNKWLSSFMAGLRDHIQRVYSSSIGYLDRAPQSLAEHLEIIEALRNRNAAAAEEVATKHVQRAEEVARKHVQLAEQVALSPKVGIQPQR